MASMCEGRTSDMRNSLAIITLLSLFAALAGCRNPGLPAEPPEHDATNPDAGLAEHRPPRNPLTRSAFEGVNLDGGGHGHHHHHGHGAATPAEGAAEAEASATEGSPDAHAGHGAPDSKGGAR
jgi:hypothetical protein